MLQQGRAVNPDTRHTLDDGNQVICVEVMDILQHSVLCFVNESAELAIHGLIEASRSAETIYQDAQTLYIHVVDERLCHDRTVSVEIDDLARIGPEAILRVQPCEIHELVDVGPHKHLTDLSRTQISPFNRVLVPAVATRQTVPKRVELKIYCLCHEANYVNELRHTGNFVSSASFHEDLEDVIPTVMLSGGVCFPLGFFVSALFVLGLKFRVRLLTQVLERLFQSFLDSFFFSFFFVFIFLCKDLYQRFFKG
mmetsp:Transcript_35664/g.81767  ORF Transcript_35664/g.81767 Transcript_35664/m.81767 type:complete len:253 (+) Transcript_35664:867-1625(+)